MFKTIQKSALASVLISFGVAILLTVGNPLGPFLFAFGLLGVCFFEADLFTGKAGYYWKSNLKQLLFILIINLIVGWLCGYFLGIANPGLIIEALIKINTWNWSFSYFIKSVLCGIIMYLCVDLYKKKCIYGIFYGIPLFIFCGFQHCIANIIILGIACSFSSTIILCILGNLIGSIIISLLNKNP